MGAVPSRPRRPGALLADVGASGSRGLGADRTLRVGSRAHRRAQNAVFRGDLAVWRAAFAVPEDDGSSDRPSAGGFIDAATHQRDLDRRARAVLGVHRADGSAHCPTRFPTRSGPTPNSPGCPSASAPSKQPGSTSASLVDTALNATTPLPDERAADALWWRIVRHLGPAALRASASRVPHSATQRGSPYLTLGWASVGERVMADAMWPALVAAVHARPAEWTPEQLLDAITTTRTDLRPRGPVLGPGVAHRDDDGRALRRAGAHRTARLRSRVDRPRPSRPAPGTRVRALPADRIVELNQWALDHYSSMFPRSWAPDYLRERLGNRPRRRRALPGRLRAARTDKPDPAPHRPRGVDRGTGRRRTRPRDRGAADWSTRSGTASCSRSTPASDLVGFIGRRNPTKETKSSPARSTSTPAGRQSSPRASSLFGLTEGAADLAAGATPVLVEGPMDAIAVTIASRRSSTSASHPWARPSPSRRQPS